jgi:biopolymer transport protein ExbD
MAGGAEEDEGGLISSINVTPLVDVTLVLLIIFMVTAKIIVSQGMPMDLPKAASTSAEQLQMIFSVELTEDGRTFVDSNLIANDDLVGALGREAKRKNPDLRAVIRADARVQHGRVIHMLDLLKQADISKIAFAVSPSKGNEGEATPTPAPPSPP